jgi:hypothetical protein
MKSFLNLLAILSLILFVSCSKEDKQQNQKSSKQDTKQEDIENPSDTLMTPEEKFSSSIMIDFLDSSEDEDLEGYLQDELFKYSKDYRGASVIQLTNSTWFVSLQNNTSTKNFILQKYVDFNSNDYYFVLKETNLTVSDIIVTAGLYHNSVIKNKETPNPQTQAQNK